jgi:hypothetical protein
MSTQHKFCISPQTLRRLTVALKRAQLERTIRQQAEESAFRRNTGAVVAAAAMGSLVSWTASRWGDPGGDVIRKNGEYAPINRGRR